MPEPAFSITLLERLFTVKWLMASTSSFFFFEGTADHCLQSFWHQSSAPIFFWKAHNRQKGN